MLTAAAATDANQNRLEQLKKLKLLQLMTMLTTANRWLKKFSGHLSFILPLLVSPCLFLSSVVVTAGPVSS